MYAAKVEKNPCQRVGNILISTTKKDGIHVDALCIQELYKFDQICDLLSVYIISQVHNKTLVQWNKDRNRSM